MTKPARVNYDRPSHQLSQATQVPGKQGWNSSYHLNGDTVLEFRGDRPKTLKTGDSVALCQPEPFGWWDSVNERVSDKTEALHNDPNAFPLYREIP